MRTIKTIKDVPFFPLIPLVPLVFLAGSLATAVIALIRVRRLERRECAGAKRTAVGKVADQHHLAGQRARAARLAVQPAQRGQLGRRLAH